jgi:signal transduction histidine kinase
MSRFTTGKVRLDPTPVLAVSVLREALEGVKPAVDAKGIGLEIDFDPFAGAVRADTTRLQQIFWNLLTNAVKFTGEGGWVAVSLRRIAGDVEIVVSDTGRGSRRNSFRSCSNRFVRWTAASIARTAA